MYVFLRHVYGSYKYEFVGLFVNLILWYLRCYTETFEMMNANLIFFLGSLNMKVFLFS